MKSTRYHSSRLSRGNEAWPHSHMTSNLLYFFCRCPCEVCLIQGQKLVAKIDRLTHQRDQASEAVKQSPHRAAKETFTTSISMRKLSRSSTAPRDLFTGNFSSNKFLSPALAQKEWREAGVYCHFHDLCGLCPDLWLSFIPPSWSGGWEILGSEIYQEAPRTGAHSRPLASVGCDEDDDNNTNNSLSSGQCEFWLLWRGTAWLSFQWLKIHTFSFSCMETTIFFMIRGLLMLISIFW